MQIERGCTSWGFQQGGRTILGERYIAGDWQGFWRFYHLGSSCRVFTIILVLSERVLWLRLFLRAVGRIEEKEGKLEIQI
jgi:hypothetical protein